MKILGIDTTGTTASVALCDENKIISEMSTNYVKNHSITIMPMISNVLDMAQTHIDHINFIACSSGPGSFTGLRIGAATAKGLAHGSGKKIIPVPTLDSLAYNVYDNQSVIAPIMDARRNQVYSAYYRWEEGQLIKISDYMAEDINFIISSLKEQNKNVIFTGDGVMLHEKIIINNGFLCAPISMRFQRGSSVACLASVYVKHDREIDYKDFEPFYIRKPQAERELEEKSFLK